MTELTEKVAEFKARQQQIIDLNTEYVKAVDAFGDDCQARTDAIKSEFEAKKAELGVEFEKAKQSYKADLKATFGVTDGKNANILDLVQLIHRVVTGK